MSEHTYLERAPGDMITAEDWNQLQAMIKVDIKSQIEAAKQEVRDGTVANAEDAEKFNGKSDPQWVEGLDERYAPFHHEHEGQSVYRRYIKRFEVGIPDAFLEHGLGRYPLVDTYILDFVTTVPPEEGEPDLTKCKILVYYGHSEVEKYGLFKKIHRTKVLYGYPLEQLLDELGVDYDDCKILDDVINDLWNAFQEDPNDEIEHCVSPWIKDVCNKKRTVDELRCAGQWEDLHVAMVPVRSCLKEEGVIITQVDYNTLHIDASNYVEGSTDPLDIMFLMRI